MNESAPQMAQIAWAAGLFEGEGCISWSGDDFALQLKNTDETVVRRFGDILELGWVYGLTIGKAATGSSESRFGCGSPSEKSAWKH